MNPANHLYIHRWAGKYGINIEMAMAAQRLAAVADDAYQIMAWLREGKLDRQFPPRPETRRWLKLYRQHRVLWVALGDAFPYRRAGGLEMLATIDVARLVQRWAVENPDELKEELQKAIHELGNQRLRRWLYRSWRRSDKAYRRHLSEMADHLAGGEGNDEGTFRETLEKSAAIHFAMAVILPCLVQYECVPMLLLRRARQGDVDAMEKLIRMDQTIIHDRKIAQWMNGGSGDERRLRGAMVCQWIIDGPKGRFTAKAVKESFAALISVVSYILGWRWKGGKLVRSPLTARQIFELFNDVARDRSMGSGPLDYDPDLEEMNLESWQKAIQRRRKAWIRGLPLGVDESLLR